MCGRFTQDLEDDDLADLYDLDEIDGLLGRKSRWNGCPTQQFVVCKSASTGERLLALHRWGLVPAWARDPKIGARLINARSETVDSKPSFRAAFRKRRCLVPTNGWFEWKANGSGKHPWWIALEGGPFSFAGLWETWDRGGAPLETFTVLTCPVSDALQGIHHRQPAIIPRESYAEWLDPATPGERLLDLARASHPGPFENWEVSVAVNSPRNDRPDLLEPV